jgi:RNA polymerase sigma-70 factor, ECF subfamily
MNMDILVSKLKTGDQEVWKMIIESYSKKVYNIALNFAGNRDEAADITQDIFLKVYNNIDKFKEDRNFTSWLLRVSKNYCIDYWRKNKYHRKNLELDESLSVPASREADTPEDTLIKHYDAEYVRKKLRLLPPDLRTLIIMRDIQDLSYQDISEHLDIPLGTTKSRINRARTKLAKIFLEEEK